MVYFYPSLFSPQLRVIDINVLPLSPSQSAMSSRGVECAANEEPFVHLHLQLLRPTNLVSELPSINHALHHHHYTMVTTISER